MDIIKIFWRLLQAPYYVKTLRTNTKGMMGKSMKFILDSDPKVDTILKRYGLYCSGCDSSHRETLDQAVKYHGLSDEQIHKLEKELSFLWKNQMKLIVFIKSSGPNLNLENLKDTLTSFHEKNCEVDYKFYLVIDPSYTRFCK